MIGKTIQKMTVSSTSRELTSSIKFSYLKNGSWKSFNGKTINSMDGIKIQETNSDFYLKYCTWNKGQNGFYPYVSSEENDYAGSDGKPVELIDIRAYDKNGTKLTSGIVVMYRAYVEGKWLPWVSNADPEYMRIIQSKYSLGGTLDTQSYYAGVSGKVMDGIEIRVFKEGYSSGDENYTNSEINPNLRYLVGNTWRSFSRGVLSSRIDGIEIHTSSNKPYYLSYRTFNEGQSSYYPAVSSTGNDYAGYPNKAIQKLSIEVFSTSGTKMTSGVIVMYRARVEGRWLPWVSNADPEWMRSVQSKYSLDGTLDTSGAYAGITGKNIEGVEVRIFEDDTSVPGSGDFDGSEAGLTLSYMKDSESNWNNFNKTVMTGDYIDGIKIQTSSSDSFYISYRTLNEGKGSYYPYVSSTENDYAGYPGKHIQRLSISVYDKTGNKLTTGIVVMYRVFVDDRWLPWVSNADPEWMRSVQSQYNLGGSLDTSASYAGIDGKNIKGVEIRAFTGQTTSGSIGGLTGNEVLPSSMRYLVGNEWHSFNRKVTASRIDGIEIKTSSDKSYYLSYQTQNQGRSYFYPAVSSTENDYAGYPNIPVQAVGIRVFTNSGTKLTAGVVVMWRTKSGGRWLPWVSNADPQWMRSVQRKYGLDGILDTSSYYAGIIGQNIEGIEIRIFEETEIDNTPQQPSGNHKIIDVPFISQVGTYPTGCESVTAVMALRNIGNNISVNSFIDNYLDKQSFPFDPNTAFGGSPYSSYGYGCYAPVIKKALDRILSGKTQKATQLSGVSLSELCSKYIDNNIPVIIWATMYMNPPYISSSWYYNGKTIQWIAPEHCLLLVGYDDNHYIFNDPLQNKQTYYNKVSVENAYAGLGRQAVIIKGTTSSSKYFGELGKQGYISDSEVVTTDDGFYMSTVSLSTILVRNGIDALIDNENNSSPCTAYFDDWYLFSVSNTFGLVKMREQESDNDDGNDPGVTVSFITFQLNKLINCINNHSSQNKKDLWTHINHVVSSEGMKHDEIMYNYFSNPASDAPYLIAERYISFIASTVKSGVIEIPDKCKKVIANYQELQSIISSPSFGMMDPSTQAALIKQKEKAGRVPEALIANNNKAGYDIFKNEKIYIKNTNDLTMYEKYAILMSHTSTVTFNSFAAEVKFHAVALKDFFSFSGWYYEKAIRADIAIGEEYESGVFDAYYNLNSDLVKEQIKYHGEY